jgi:hypothetical protein
MREACSLIWSALVLLLRSRASLAAEILVLRHQINTLRRHSPKRQTFSAMDRLIFGGLYRSAPTVLNALAVLKPDKPEAAADQHLQDGRKGIYRDRYQSGDAVVVDVQRSSATRLPLFPRLGKHVVGRQQRDLDPVRLQTFRMQQTPLTCRCRNS